MVFVKLFNGLTVFAPFKSKYKLNEVVYKIIEGNLANCDWLLYKNNPRFSTGGYFFYIGNKYIKFIFLHNCTMCKCKGNPENLADANSLAPQVRIQPFDWLTLVVDIWL